MIYERFAALGVGIPEILLPDSKVDLETWAVIACDQFSSEKHFWKETRRLVDGNPSTLDLIIPECYLEDGDIEQRIESAQLAMSNLKDKNLLRPMEPGFLLTKRSTTLNPSRKGLILTIDLEAYDFETGSTGLIRPTEDTIQDRLPPRMIVRRNADLDLSHVLLLIDDARDLLMTAAEGGPLLYDFELLQGGGHITGQSVTGDALLPVLEALETLAAENTPLFAVGDGNHSLAAAKKIWLEKKAKGISDDHPTRWALVEVENIHDTGLHFHPIHRLLFGVRPEFHAEILKDTLGAESESVEILDEKMLKNDEDQGRIGVLGPGFKELWRFPIPAGRLAVEGLQAALDDLTAGNPELRVDYIHGAHSVRELAASAPDRLGLILPSLDKYRFFDRIATIGPYPRKTFSIGEAMEKRYYLETRSLTR